MIRVLVTRNVGHLRPKTKSSAVGGPKMQKQLLFLYCWLTQKHLFACCWDFENLLSSSKVTFKWFRFWSSVFMYKDVSSVLSVIGFLHLPNRMLEVLKNAIVCSKFKITDWRRKTASFYQLMSSKLILTLDRHLKNLLEIFFYNLMTGQQHFKKAPGWSQEQVILLKKGLWFEDTWLACSLFGLCFQCQGRLRACILMLSVIILWRGSGFFLKWHFLGHSKLPRIHWRTWVQTPVLAELFCKLNIQLLAKILLPYSCLSLW